MLQMAHDSPGSADGEGWRELYQAAMLELDESQLPQRILEARKAIRDRAEHTITAPSGDELSALNDALRSLRILEDVYARGKPAA